MDDLRLDVKQLKDDLLPIETNAQSGIDLAKARFEDAKAIQEDANKIHDNNSKLVDEALQFNMEIKDKIGEAKKALHKFEDGQDVLGQTAANVSVIHVHYVLLHMSLTYVLHTFYIRFRLQESQMKQKKKCKMQMLLFIWQLTLKNT